MLASFSSITLVRWKKLKGGRKIIRSHRTVNCNTPIRVGEDGTFRSIVSCSGGVFVMDGKQTDSTFSVFGSKIMARRKPYLRKGFTEILGYNLRTVKSNA